MANYATDLLPGRPYGAGVYADGHVHVEHWTPTNADLERGTFRSVVVFGNQLRVVNAVPTAASDRHMRQADVIGTTGTTTMKKLRVAVVGAGGTGSHVPLAPVYPRFTDVLILDDAHLAPSHPTPLTTDTLADLA